MPINIKIDRSDIISLMALLMSMGAVFVAIKQTSILREQQKIMASQQEGSVWPHLDVNASVNKDSVSATFTMKVHNNGIGPAILTNFKFNEAYVDPLDFKGLYEILEKSDVNIKAILEARFTHPNGKTIPSRGDVSVISLTIDDPEKNYDKLFQVLDELSSPKYCYESVYKTKYGNACE